MKRLLSLLLVFAMVASYLPVTAEAEETIPAETADEIIETVPVETETVPETTEEVIPETTEEVISETTVEVIPETTVETVPEITLPQWELPVIPDRVTELPKATTNGYSIATFSRDAIGNPSLTSGNHEKWIDRVDLEAYAIDFYNWLVENSNNDNNDDALIDVTQGEEYLYTDSETGETLAEGYVHYLTMIGGDIRLALPYDVDEETLVNALAEAVYDIMTANDLRVNTGVYTVFDAFDRDHPEVFWLDGRFVRSIFYLIDYYYNGSAWVFDYEQDFLLDLSVRDYSYGETFDIRAADYQSPSAIRSGIAKRDNAVNSILDQIPDNTNAANKVAFFNDWLTKHNGYNTSGDLYAIGYDCRECLSALTGSVGTNGPVCEGYARAFKVLCDASNIQCVLVNGDANNGSSTEAHMWNYVNILGSWYGVDVTWNDPESGSAAISGYECEDYLLVGSNTVVDGMTFSQSHPVSNMVTDGGVAFTNGPKLSEKDYCVHSFSTPVFRFENEIFYADFTCTKCEIIETVPGVITNKQINAATATMDGSIVYTVAFTSPDGKEYTHTHTQVIPATGEQEGFIDNGTLGENLTWTLDQNGKLTISGTGFMHQCELETQVPWAAYRDQILTVVIEEGVTSVGNYAFYGCWKLEEVSLPNSMEGIYPNAFNGCKSLKSVTLSDNVVLVGNNAFYLCESMETLDLGEGVAHIGESAFDCCRSLTEITIPASVSTIDAYAFRSCEGLKTVTFEGRWPVISSSAFNGDTFNAYYPADEDTWTADKLTNYGGRIIWHAVSGGGEVVPQNPSGKCGENLTWTLDLTTGVLTISGTGYMDGKDSSIYKPWYEYQEQITKVVIEEGVTTIGKNMFALMPNLTEVQLPKSLRYIEAAAFEMSEALKAIDLTYVERVESAAFHGCTGLTEVTIPDGIALEGSDNRGVFTGCTGIKKVTVGNFTDTGGYLFSGCTALTEVTLKEGMEKLSGHMFDGCTALKTVNIPAGADIGGGAFANCTALTSVTFTREIGTVGEQAFKGCTGLTSFTFPQVEALSSSIFSLCENLHTIYFKGSAPTFDRITLGNIKVTIYYPSGDSSWNDKVNGHFGASIDIWKPYNVSHTFDTPIVTAPTCVDQGYTTYFCTDCGYSYQGNFVAATGVHTYLSEHDSTCEICGFVREVVESDTIPFSDAEWAVLKLVNQERTKAGLAPVTGFALLQDAAGIRADEQAELYSHTRPDGRSCFTVLEDLGIADIDYIYAGENIAYGYRSAAAVMDGWMNSQGHRENILFSNFQHIGVGELNTYYWVQLFTSGSGYSSISVAVPEDLSIDPGTSIDALDLIATLNSKAYGKCYLPVAAAYCTGYDPAKTGDQTVTITVSGVSTTFALHVHNWDTSGCTAQKVCTHCGEAVGAGSGHSYGAWTENKAPTCTEKGEERRECTKCGDVETREKAAKGHSYTSTITKPTCTEMGYTTFTCTCGDSYVDDYVNALGHTEAIDEAVKPTCTETGKTEGKHCSVCNTVLVKQETVPAKGHSYEAVVTAPTCTEKGYTTHTCTACGDTYTNNETAAMGHSFGSWEITIEATCTAKGEERRDCANCDHFETRETEMIRHVYDTVVTAPTCGKQGYTTYTCTCGDTFVDNYVEATGKHSYTNNICTVCGHILQQDIPFTEDEWEVLKLTNRERAKEGLAPLTGFAKLQDAVQVRANESGSTSQSHMRPDGRIWYTIMDDYGIKYGENSGENLAYAGTAAGAVGAWMASGGHRKNIMRDNQHMGAARSGNYWAQIFTCGGSYTSLKVLVPERYGVEGGTSIDEMNLVAVLNSTTNGTCYLPVVADYCTGFNPTLAGNQTVTISVLGLTAKFNIHVHWWLSGSCTGSKTCMLCGETVSGNEGHTLGNWKQYTAPTCTTPGEERQTCVNCSYYESRELPATGHTEVIDPKVDPTCTDAGLTEGKHCSVCGTVLTAQEEISATGHKWDNGKVTKEPTATEDGVKTYTCAACGETKTEVIPATGEEIVWGDADGDGLVTPIDALLALQCYTGEIGEKDLNRNSCDVDGNNMVNPLDALYILQRYTGEITEFPVEINS